MQAKNYTLYGRPGTGSAAVEAFFEEAGVAYETVMAETDALLALNPLGQVPVLVLPSGEVMTESAAIILYLADRHREAGLAPASDSPLRARYLRWMVFMAANSYMAHIRFYTPARHTADPDGADAVKRAAEADLDRQFAILAEAVGHGPWFLGETFSALDLYAPMMIAWAGNVQDVFRRHPNLARHYARIKARPKVGPVWARHNMDL